MPALVPEVVPRDDETRDDRFQRLFVDDAVHTAQTVFDHIANGGSPIELAEMWEIPYNRLARFMTDHPDRLKLWKESFIARNEWLAQRIPQEVQKIAIKDPKTSNSDKLRALELLGRGQGLFVQEIKHSGKVTYEQFMAQTYPEPPSVKKEESNDSDSND